MNIFRFDGTAFVQVPGSLASIAVGCVAAAWGINDSGQIYRFDGKAAFVQIPGRSQALRLGPTARSGA
jgi:hypothetical protein